jgi:glycine/D-amino acid oxidase-like deaminating enzyme
MKLKSGRLYWPRMAKKHTHFAPLRRDVQCDVAIIGAGITGALSAFHLAEAGVDVGMVDRRQPSHGSTAASTGLLQYEIDTPLTTLSKMIGPKHARRAYQLSWRSIADFKRLITKLGDDCGFVRRPSLYLASKKPESDFFHDEWRARKSAGIAVELLDQAAIEKRFGFKRPAALWSQSAAQVDPYRLTQALHRRSLEMGTRIFGDTEIIKYVSHRDGVTLGTSRGHQIHAKKIVFATGYETPEFVDRKLCKLKSTYAVASQPIKPFPPQWREHCLIWEHRDPYFYLRTSLDGRAIIGGEDIDDANPKHRDRLIAKKTARLIEKFNQLFPDVKFKPAFTWAGTFAETKDGLPYIGSLAQYPHGYFALGYGGNGITFSLMAAKIIRDLFLKRKNHDAQLFAFNR